jgi:hypothetical protein
MVTVGGEFGGVAGVHVTMSRISWRIPSFFLKVVRPLTVDIGLLLKSFFGKVSNNGKEVIGSFES